MKPSFSSAREQLAGNSPLMRDHPHAPRSVLQSPRPESAATRGRWLTTLPASLSIVREATLSALSDIPADLAYLYHADDKVVIRAIDSEHQIRVEIMPIDGRSTRISVTCTREGDVDRARSARLVRAVEAHLP
ncbi:MAG: hypothetical protein IT537_27640 [Hyphomicrobiales bacterium]|nr:hypothetical protein [Hyphomicrobiales bacterium]